MEEGPVSGDKKRCGKCGKQALEGTELCQACTEESVKQNKAVIDLHRQILGGFPHNFSPPSISKP